MADYQTSIPQISVSRHEKGVSFTISFPNGARLQSERQYTTEQAAFEAARELFRVLFLGERPGMAPMAVDAKVWWL